MAVLAQSGVLARKGLAAAAAAAAHAGPGALHSALKVQPLLRMLAMSMALQPLQSVRNAAYHSSNALLSALRVWKLSVALKLREDQQLRAGSCKRHLQASPNPAVAFLESAY